jgi:hypothetical protein
MNIIKCKYCRIEFEPMENMLVSVEWTNERQR